MAQPNYRKIYAIKKMNEKRILDVCPDMKRESGIYFYTRTDENGISYFYIGQSVDCLERSISHLTGYQHIDLSIKKRGFYSEKNPYGWKLYYKTCPESELDDREISTIKAFADKGFQMYNVTAGGQGLGKVISGQYKQPKTYTQGIQQGKKVLARELSSIAEKHLKIEIRDDKKHNKISQKQYEKFMDLLKAGGVDG